MAFVPTTLLLTTDCIPDDFKERHRGISVQGLLASYLAHAPPKQLEHLEVWKATWPSKAEYAAVMPVTLPPSLRRKLQWTLHGVKREFHLLPPSLAGLSLPVMGDGQCPEDHPPLLLKQEAKLQQDWAAVREALPDAVLEEYRYFWLLVNTRSFYYDLPLRLEPQTHDDRMILCPFLDYFNHADHGVSPIRVRRAPF